MLQCRRSGICGCGDLGDAVISQWLHLSEGRRVIHRSLGFELASSSPAQCSGWAFMTELFLVIMINENSCVSVFFNPKVCVPSFFFLVKQKGVPK